MVKHLCPFENCNSTFSRPSRLKIHIQRHRGIKEFQCDLCDCGYHRRQHLKRHVAEMHQTQQRLEQPLSCNHCQQQFSTAWGLRRHLIKIKKKKTDGRQQPRQHQCEVCKKKFHNADNLIKHHSIKHERFKCTIPSCPLSAHNFHWTFYKHHMAKYHSDPFECEHCSEKFVFKSQIRNHVTQHMPEYTCTQPNCNKTYSNARNMAYHERVAHRDERIFKCDVNGCDWKFKYKNCLQRHIRVHQENGKIIPMEIFRLKKKPLKFITAQKLAGLSLKV